MRVQAANALVTPSMISPCPIMAAVMFGHALGDTIGCETTGVAIIHHDAQLRGERMNPHKRKEFQPHQMRSATYINGKDYANKSNGPTLSLQPVALADLEWSIILELSCDGEAGLNAGQIKKLRKRLRGGRLAGGQIVGYSAADEAFPALLGKEGAIAKKIGGGHALIDRSDRLIHPERSRLEQLMKIGTGDRDVVAEESGFFVPAPMGYAMVTEFEERKGSREGLPHAFGEIMVGLAEYAGIRTLGERGFEAQSLLWRHHWDVDNAAFILSQESY
ncbi:type I-F CRISPR-associated protein Csy2 [Thioalkalivibrio sp. ALE23]|uniref:type I-F CRISPR-associated protein Csy2 n=2 Tax=unclassified Thioalkalivibrio TaxID=2621013 RepID=UPI0018C9B891|nr:type I-F CRISPR-associated protein Csy2 [Thioalkalivibrio sp. ALE23]